MFHRFGLIDKNQKGFTMIELLVAILITAIILGSVTTAISQVFTVNARSSNRMTAVRQVQTAGYWVSHDAQMAQTATADNLTSPFVLKLTWTEWSGVTHTDNYTLENKVLWRNLDGQKSLVAQYITSANTTYTGGKLIFNVTATVGTAPRAATETRVYEVMPRPSS